MIRVAQCWDDGVVNDVRVAEICRKYHAKATFNINPGLRKADERVTGWRFRDMFDVCGLSLKEMPEVYKGFQVASHTMHHMNADKGTVEAFVKEAVDARHFIEDTFGQEAPGFAWPCGVTTDATVKALADAGFAYGRTTVNVPQVLPVAEPLRLHSNCHFLNPNFWEAYETAKPCGVFYFWGHSYEMMDDAQLWAGYEEKIARLSADPEVEWIDVVDIVR